MTSRLASLIDPRRHLAAAVGWTVLAVLTLAALIAADLAARSAEARVRGDTEARLDQFADRIQTALGDSLRARLAIVQATAVQLSPLGQRDDAELRRPLQAVRHRFPEFEWLGVADATGRLLAATGRPSPWTTRSVNAGWPLRCAAPGWERSARQAGATAASRPIG